MSRGRLIAIVAAVVALVGVAVLVRIMQGGRYKLVLTVAAAQEVYREGEQIEVKLKLVNEGESRFPRAWAAWVRRIPYIGRWFGGNLWLRFSVSARTSRGDACVKPRWAWSSFDGWLTQKPGVIAGEEIELPFKINQLFLLSGPGTYTITGIFTASRGREGSHEVFSLRSEPISISIEARSVDQMGGHVEGLMRDLASAEAYDSDKAVSSALWRLIYTRDRRMLPVLLDFAYADKEQDAVRSALMSYLPIEAETREMILDGARERGLTETIFDALRRFGCGQEELREVITKSLESSNGRTVRAGARAAAMYPDDSHTAQLIQVARDSESGGQLAAISALALNRTEEGVRALRGLIEDGDQDIKYHTLSAINLAYGGRLAVDEDRPYQGWRRSGLIRAARDPNSPDRWEAVGELIERLGDGDFDIVKSLAGGVLEEGAVGEAREEVEIVEALLNDTDRDVRDTVTTLIRLRRRRFPGRALKAEDFPEVFAD